MELLLAHYTKEGCFKAWFKEDNLDLRIDFTLIKVNLGHLSTLTTYTTDRSPQTHRINHSKSFRVVKASLLATLQTTQLIFLRMAMILKMGIQIPVTWESSILLFKCLTSTIRLLLRTSTFRAHTTRKTTKIHIWCCKTIFQKVNKAEQTKKLAQTWYYLNKVLPPVKGHLLTRLKHSHHIILERIQDLKGATV